MTPEQEDKINVLTLEVKRLSARLNDAINLMYNLENRIVKKVNHQVMVQSNVDMPRALKTGSFVAHGKGKDKAGGKKE